MKPRTLNNVKKVELKVAENVAIDIGENAIETLAGGGKKVKKSKKKTKSR